MSRIRVLRSLLASGCTCAMLLACAATAQAQQYDQPSAQAQTAGDSAEQAPGRVARLAYLSGQVQFAPAGENDWGSVDINRPMVIGDRLLTGDDGRAVLELGDASVRIDHDSAFDFLNLDQNNVQIELSQGTLNLAVRQMAQGDNFEVDTPTVAFVASTPGVYRIDDNPSGTGSMVTVFRGAGTVYGENGVSRQVAAGTSYRFNDSTLTSVDVSGLPQADDFDQFCETRDANYERYTQQQQQYVPPDMIGGDDLDQYGQWNAVPQYGNVWYPTSVPAGWAPYRYGHWAWIDPWGWTWVDNQPWGFAPFHYGRWAYISNRWGWMPGPVGARPVYAPALVAFIGGSGLSLSLRAGGGPVGWFPLGPRDVYVPWFHASRRYFTNVNVTNIRNVYVNQTVINNIYNDYSRNQTANIHRYNRYTYRNMPGAVTAVPRDVFTGARPVHPAALKLDRTQLARTSVAVRPGVNPGKASLGLRQPTTRPTAFHGREPFTRPVVARHTPPPRPVEFAAREKIIAGQHGQPLTEAQMRNLRTSRPTTEPRNQRVKLVPATIGATPRAATRVAPARPGVVQRPAEPVARHGTTPTEPSFKNTLHPTSARSQPARTPALRPGEMPSARFRNPGQPNTLPRAPTLRTAGEPQHTPPASGRLPVVRPVERAPQPVNNQPAPQQRQADTATQQRVRAQQLQQQRSQEQTQQRAREQQTQRQREAQMQQQREVQVQQPRQVQEQRQTQQRATEIQREQQFRARPVAAPPQRHAPQPRNRAAPEHRPPPSKKHPDNSSGDTPIR